MARVKKSLFQNHTGSFAKNARKIYIFIWNRKHKNFFPLRVRFITPQKYQQILPVDICGFCFSPNFSQTKRIKIREDLRELIDGCMQRELGVPTTRSGGSLGAEDSCDSTMGHNSQHKLSGLSDPFQSSHSCNVGMTFICQHIFARLRFLSSWKMFYLTLTCFDKKYKR